MTRSASRTMEAYWAGFAAWMLGRLDRRWRRTRLGDRLEIAVLDVGEALVVGGAAPEVERLAWLLAVAELRGTLTREELARAWSAVEVARGMAATSPRGRSAAR